jgi:transposase-like protein
MARKHKPSTTPDRRVYADEFKREAVAMLLVGHSASTISLAITSRARTLTTGQKFSTRSTVA